VSSSAETGGERVVFEGSRFAAPLPVELSVIIPTLDDAENIAQLLEDLRLLSMRHEVIVADGGSSDATRDVARRLGAQVIAAPRGRGAQLAAGAAHARADLLCFLHADVRLDLRAIVLIERLVRARPKGAYAFRLRIDDARVGYRLIEWQANARSRWAHLPDGDQGLIVWRADYERAGGYQAVPLLEDVALVRALGRVTRVRTLPAALHVSPRRWTGKGPLRGVLRSWRMLTAYLTGASPEELAARYRPHEEMARSRDG
jgi:rSAM/selenodomain-associated transferase 2